MEAEGILSCYLAVYSVRSSSLLHMGVLFLNNRAIVHSVLSQLLTA